MHLLSVEYLYNLYNLKKEKGQCHVIVFPMSKNVIVSKNYESIFK